MNHPIRASLVAALAAALAGCATDNVPTFEARGEYVIAMPHALSKPGTQAKILLPGMITPVLLWRTEIGFGAASIRCTCCQKEVRYNPEQSFIECPRGSRFGLDGRVRQGQARWPLRAYDVDLQGTNLKILG